MPRRARGERSRGHKEPREPLPSSVVVIDLSSIADSMPVPQLSQRRKRSRVPEEHNELLPSSDAVIDLSSIADSVSVPQPSQRQKTSRGRASRGRTSRGRRQRNMSRSSTDILGDLPTDTSLSPVPRSSRRRSRRGSQQVRPAVTINLDVTYSSDELEEELPSSPVEQSDSLFNFTMTPSPKKGQQNNDEVRSPTPMSPPTNDVEEALEDPEGSKEIDDYPSDYEEDDILFMDYDAKRDEALKEAFTEIRSLEKEEAAKKRIDLQDEKLQEKENIDDSVTLADVEKSAEEVSGYLDLSNLESSTLDSPVELPKKKKLRKTKKTVKALESLKLLSEEISQMRANGSFNGGVTILSDDEDIDVESETITLFVKWESDYIRSRVRKFQKFSSVYKEIAERLNFDVETILLCYDDKIISHETCPGDLNLKYGDVIECGVQSQPTAQRNETVNKSKHSPGSIPLKIQSSDRKGTVTIYIGENAKMKELMQRYAEEKNIPVEELQFSFDGEHLNPNDTPKSLDLEGNECIDVYRK